MIPEKMVVQISVKDHEMALYGPLVRKIENNLLFCEKSNCHYNPDLKRTLIYFEVTYGWIGTHMMDLLHDLHDVGIGFKTSIKKVYEGTTFQEFQESLCS